MSARRLGHVQQQLAPREVGSMEPVGSPLTTHVLDTASGLPAQGLLLRLSRLENSNQQWTELRKSYTNADGRCPGLLTSSQLKPGTYKLFFDTGSYWNQMGQTSFYPYVEVKLMGKGLGGSVCVCVQAKKHRGLGGRAPLGCKHLKDRQAPQLSFCPHSLST
uniref:Transthyretin n=2 Tax=Ornithorhynchus anatinus TaxID=9258 RepID=F6TMQ6_ORNAN